MSEAERELTYFDGLTNLPNRTLFTKRLAEVMSRHVSDTGQFLAVMFLDLDRFKVVNDSLGHAAGDQLLVEVAGRLKDAVSAENVLARFGGDEFTLLLEGIDGVDQATAAAEAALAALQEPFMVDGHETFVTSSIGLALLSAEHSSPEDLLRDAGTALYRAKAAGRDRYLLFDPRMHSESLQRLSLEAELRRALERNELRLKYQPYYDVASGRITGVEALLRWAHPERGAISPAEIIPLAEETGLIVPVGQWVLSEASRQAAEWMRRYPDVSLEMSVNLSGRQLQRPELVAEVAETVRITGVEPSRLKLEITESVLLEDNEPLRQRLESLRSLGIRLAPDDFGAGYSSLSYLRFLPVQTVKIDRSFVTTLATDERMRAAVRAVTDVAHAFGMDVTAEGIETEEQLGLIRSAGCDTAQGFLMAKPLDAAEVEILLADAFDTSQAA